MFDFDLSTKTTASAEELRKKATSNRFINRPGEYTLNILSREITKINGSDPSWFNTKILTETADGLQFGLYPLIPKTAANNFAFKSPTMTEPSDFALKGIFSFLTGLGVQVEDFNDIPAICKALFHDSEIMVGKKINVVIGYKGIHVKWAKKDDNGDNLYQAFNNEDVFAMGEDENRVTSPLLPSADAIVNWLTGLGIEEKKIHKFPEILKFLSAPQQINVLAPAKPEAATEVSENPFA